MEHFAILKGELEGSSSFSEVGQNLSNVGKSVRVESFTEFTSVIVSKFVNVCVYLSSKSNDSTISQINQMKPNSMAIGPSLHAGRVIFRHASKLTINLW